MIRIVPSLLLILFCLVPCRLQAEEEVTLSPPAPVYDQKKIEKYQADKQYDYNSQLQNAPRKKNNPLSKWLNRGLRKVFTRDLSFLETQFLILFMVLLFVLGWFIWKKHPALFLRSRKDPLAYEVEEDTIHERNLDQEIGQAFEKENYREAIRLTYLNCLKELDRQEIIRWELYKTPADYLYENKLIQGKEEFRSLTHLFQQIRYGRSTATAELYKKGRTLYHTIQKGGSGE
ncbi:MAG: DUF4129 domain-containing protein [Bacteroides sp.]|nr:DUF4129 domain-containing protein [Bacteroides sp.]